MGIFNNGISEIIKDNEKHNRKLLERLSVIFPVPLLNINMEYMIVSITKS